MPWRRSTPYCYYEDPGTGGTSCTKICTNVGKSCNLTGTQAVAGQTECKRILEEQWLSNGTSGKIEDSQNETLPSTPTPFEMDDREHSK